MSGKVIQGSFLGGQSKLAASAKPKMMPPPIQAKTTAGPPVPVFAGRHRSPTSAFAARSPGPPAAAFASRPPGPTAPAFAGRPGTVQRHGAGGAFAVEAGQLGLASAGGKPLPDAVRGKMEAALGADFSNVRVHVGPQAERIGAIAFTIGSDIYFAPGRYQPDTVHGQQLLGHELAHVVQQRAGRVCNPLFSRLAVVQDRALEAEADRLGQRAAMHRIAAQAKMPTVVAEPAAPVRISPPAGTGPGSHWLTAATGGHQVGSVMVHARDKGAVEVTDLPVAEAQRGHGVSRMLLASAVRTGQQFGKSTETLGGLDNGSGHLTQWYKGMGLAQVGVNHRGYPQLEAPIGRVIAGTTQRQVGWRSSGTLKAIEQPPPPTPGKRVIADLTDPRWQNSYNHRGSSPPPTKFGPDNAQAKPATVISRAVIPPLPTPFTAAPIQPQGRSHGASPLATQSGSGTAIVPPAVHWSSVAPTAAFGAAVGLSQRNSIGSDTTERARVVQRMEGAWSQSDATPTKLIFKSGNVSDLHEQLHQAIMDLLDRIDLIDMSNDYTSYNEFAYQWGINVPVKQLQICMDKCKFASETDLALCLYTCYFYEPLNKYFRGLSIPSINSEVGKLIIMTAQVILRAFRALGNQWNTDRRFRVELKSDWIKGNEQKLSFSAPTSTHPNLSGVKAMWGDVANGTFGDVTRISILVFEDHDKIIQPVYKYFPDEVEGILEPGNIYNVVLAYETEIEIFEEGPTQIRVFHLSKFSAAFYSKNPPPRLTPHDLI